MRRHSVIDQLVRQLDKPTLIIDDLFVAPTPGPTDDPEEIEQMYEEEATDG